MRGGEEGGGAPGAPAALARSLGRGDTRSLSHAPPPPALHSGMRVDGLAHWEAAVVCDCPREPNIQCRGTPPHCLVPGRCAVAWQQCLTAAFIAAWRIASCCARGHVVSPAHPAPRGHRLAGPPPSFGQGVRVERTRSGLRAGVQDGLIPSVRQNVPSPLPSF